MAVHIFTKLKECEMIPTTPVPDHADSLLPAGKKWRLAWHDEFDGNALDETKWNYRLYFWGYRSPTWTEGTEKVENTVYIWYNTIIKYRRCFYD